MCIQNARVLKRNSLDSNLQPHALHSCALPVQVYFCVSSEMLLEFSPLLCLQPTAESIVITAITYGGKLEVR